MADALCGPSIAIQNFQKHLQVDRTLQQDRLVSRHSPVQGFRSSPGPNAGLLDPEFEAFQAGHVASPPPQFDTRPFIPQNNISHFLHPPQAQVGLPDWANDFQRMHIAPAHSIAHQHSSAPAVQRVQAAVPQPSWHQDFMQSQQPMTSFRQPQPMFNSLQGSQWNYQQPVQFSPIAQGKQKLQEQDSQWGAEAFAKAFEDASMDAAEADPMDGDYLQEMLRQEIAKEIEQESEVTEWVVQSAREQEHGPHYDDGLSQEKLEQEIAREIEMESEEIQWIIQSNAEAREAQAESTRLETNHLQGLDLSHDFLDVDEEFKTGEEHEYSDDPHPFLRMDDVMHQPGHDLAQQEQQETRASSPRSVDEDLARTAGQLLQSVEHDTSEKFQSSVFLQLMRRLRDKEVTVEGENFVETGDFGLAGPTLSATPRIIPANEQDLDLGRFGGMEEVREDSEPDAVMLEAERSPTPDFDAPGPPFEDWRNRLWAGMPGMVTT